MHIEERKVTVREVTERYFNDAEEDVVGYDEQLKGPETTFLPFNQGSVVTGKDGGAGTEGENLFQLCG